MSFRSVKNYKQEVKTQSLIVLNKTSISAVLLECLFADSSKYNSEIIAGAIADGLSCYYKKMNKYY